MPLGIPHADLVDRLKAARILFHGADVDVLAGPEDEEAAGCLLFGDISQAGIIFQMPLP